MITPGTKSPRAQPQLPPKILPVDYVRLTSRETGKPNLWSPPRHSHGAWRIVISRKPQGMSQCYIPSLYVIHFKGAPNSGEAQVDINSGCFSQKMLPFEVQIVSQLMKSSVEVSSGAPW
jgi:hypothetical protein